MWTMKRLLLLTLLLAAGPAQAGPRHVLGKIAKAAIIWGAPMASSLLATHGVLDCHRRNGPEFCSAGYGSVAGTETVRNTASLSLSAATWGCLRETSWKGCYGIAASTTAYNLWVWRDQEGKRSKL
jgi:hypothetical protein